MIKEALVKVISKKDLSFEEAREAVEEIMSGEVSPVVISSFLTALSMKGETDEEIAGAAEGMRSKALSFDNDCTVLDIVGTGGDKSNSFNISTTAAFVAAANGIKIAKHGNRAASSKCGTADCLEAVGVKIDCDTELMKKSIEENNISFLFAQKYHSAMRFVGPVRKELGIRTIFNVLGPLTNPAHANQMVLGVFSREFVPKIAKALTKLGVTDALVVYGLDCLDEISACSETAVAEVRDGVITEYTIKPEDFGYERVDKSGLLGGTPEENSQIVKNVLSGNGTKAQNTAVIMNAGACMYVADRSITFAEAVKKAEETLMSGRGYDILQKFIKTTNEG
ncbi:MAG: anthranilate phosphoribosyltransferase [Acetobacter sp.]|nr:anthranilate phosphoribosyltransferase [Bacteroides sp.]MCM1341318.1 anthranilate phosphoribosyltransferase [Acetobacter sp.]MCM1433906.1 anthranilate phosphoribosyltransferase [Clostridiales bacterium]